MSFRGELHAHIRDSLDVQVTPDFLPQNPVLPAVVYFFVDGSDPAVSHSGDSQLRQRRVQFDCWARSDVAVNDLADALIALLHGWHGTLASVKVGSAILANDLDSYDPATRLWRRIVDVIFIHEQLAIAS